MSHPAGFRQHWQLDPDVDFLNHGSFGATPTVVLQRQRQLQDALEREPIRFLAAERELVPKLDTVRRRIAQLVDVHADDIALVRNATDGVNAVMRSLAFRVRDEIVITDHGYNACNNVARFVAARSGAVIREAKIPFPINHQQEVVAAIDRQLSDRTRLLLVDHVTSSTGLIFPIQQIVELAHSRGVRALVDGAHAVGMLPIHLSQIGADYYTANHHKWLCAPKASGFLYVRPDCQSETRPTVISHGANTPRPGRTRFLAEFDWIGTYDPTPVLATESAIDFLDHLYPGGLDELQEVNHRLAVQARQQLLDRLQIDSPAPVEMIGSMASIPLPDSDAATSAAVDPLQQRLFDRHRIEVPVFRGPSGGRTLRISAQAYNQLEQYQRLAAILSDELKVRPDEERLC